MQQPMDEYKIDSHKLIYHVGRVNDWLNGKDIAPLYMDVSITSACNHNCVFCGLDYARKKVAFLEPGIYEKMIRDAAAMGVKSLVFAGEGEPLVQKHCAEMIAFTKKSGIDIALATNAVLMDERFSSQALPYLTWVRVSLDAGSPGTYRDIHRADKDDFNKVIENITRAVELKKKRRHAVTIGVQFILLEENAAELESITKRIGRIGADYFVVKPYSKHPFSLNNAGAGIEYSKMEHLKEKVERHATAKFNVIFRSNAMEKRARPKSYGVCYGIPFWVYISSSGDVYPCNTFLAVDKFSFGNLNRKSFLSIWKSGRRRKIMAYFRGKFNVRNCREMCRLDEINNYLWQLKNPHPHVNFI